MQAGRDQLVMARQRVMVAIQRAQAATVAVRRQAFARQAAAGATPGRPPIGDRRSHDQTSADFLVTGRRRLPISLARYQLAGPTSATYRIDAWDAPRTAIVPVTADAFRMYVWDALVGVITAMI